MKEQINKNFISHFRPVNSRRRGEGDGRDIPHQKYSIAATQNTVVGKKYAVLV